MGIDPVSGKPIEPLKEVQPTPKPIDDVTADDGSGLSPMEQMFGHKLTKEENQKLV